MRRVPIVVAATVTGALAAGWVGAQGTRGPALTGQDYAEIEQLIARYYQALDFEDRAMFESIWTEDAVYRIESMGQPVEGRDAIVQRTVGRWADRPPEHERRHWQNNLVVTPTPDGATARAYWISFEVSYSPPKPALSGHYDDVLVRTPDGWRFKERVLTIDRSLRDGIFGHVWEGQDHEPPNPLPTVAPARARSRPRRRRARRRGLRRSCCATGVRARGRRAPRVRPRAGRAAHARRQRVPGDREREQPPGPHARGQRGLRHRQRARRTGRRSLPPAPGGRARADPLRHLQPLPRGPHRRPSVLDRGGPRGHRPPRVRGGAALPAGAGAAPAPAPAAAAPRPGRAPPQLAAAAARCPDRAGHPRRRSGPQVRGGRGAVRGAEHAWRRGGRQRLALAARPADVVHGRYPRLHLAGLSQHLHDARREDPPADGVHPHAGALHRPGAGHAGAQPSRPHRGSRQRAGRPAQGARRGAPRPRRGGGRHERGQDGPRGDGRRDAAARAGPAAGARQGVVGGEEHLGVLRHLVPLRQHDPELYPVPARDVYGELAGLVGTDALLARARDHLAGGRPLHALHFIEMALGGAPEHVAALRLYLDAHQRLLAASRILNNAYEQNYLRSEIDRTEAALESLQPPR